MKAKRTATKQHVDQLPTPRRGRPPRDPKLVAAIEREREQLRHKREVALVSARVRKLDIENALGAEGITLSHTTITNVIAGVHRNSDVERVFCQLTLTKPAEMFPASRAFAEAK